MALLSKPIDTNDMPNDDSHGSYEPVQEGWYGVQIESVELLDNKAGTGSYFKICCKIISSNRLIWANITYTHTSAKAQEIGTIKLGELLRAAGIQRLRDTDELIGAIVEAKVTIRPATDRYPASNDIKAWRASENKPQRAPAPAKSASAGAPPWMR